MSFFNSSSNTAVSLRKKIKSFEILNFHSLKICLNFYNFLRGHIPDGMIKQWVNKREIHSLKTKKEQRGKK